MAERQVNIRNKRASFDYHLLEKFTAGIQLTGTEIKSIRESKASISDAYCIFRNGELWVKNMHISEYEKGTFANHEPLRERKLLLKKNELNKLDKKIREKGFTIIPLSVFISGRGFAKMEIALAKGKKVHDKRESIREKDTRRELERMTKRR
ncbi:MAG TPA: SsrA-binding protein SmpB [Chitinophagales bacterium]|nr:SsrA-binding protein SmpB [Chitinophagales bacterium]